MIELTTADEKTRIRLGDAGKVSVNEDLIVLMQRQNNVSGKDFTAIFIMGGMPPYAVVETRAEVDLKITEARRARYGVTQ